MEEGGYGFPVGEAGLIGDLAGVEGPVGTQQVRRRSAPVWSSQARAWDGSTDHGRKRKGSRATSAAVPMRPLKGGVGPEVQGPWAGSPQHLPSPSEIQSSGVGIMKLLTSLSPQILLISDYFYAFLRREYYLTHGLYLTTKDGTEAMLVLK